ncbi:hypothetical protein QAD02_020864 [Eretmocerus hayati]|uniref:Uncharacterized protein n=1 Tax=Eretmocerus hayati TaxID=131215 RepID=A0ACC2PNJ5_9HYME|nr:hypothetical protein QAD02_020864 [Eretmocerus hayati]
MGAIHIDKATEDDLSSLESTFRGDLDDDAMDLETEMKLLNEADKVRKEGMSNMSKEALDRKSMSRIDIEERSVQPAVQTPTTGKSAKRVRSAEEGANAAKKAKPSTSFESPRECQIAIIDRSDPDGRMTPERWLMVESRILVAIAEGPENGSDDGVEFDGAGWQKGVKVVGCSNRKSHDFLVQVVGNCGELWPGVKLEVIPRSELPLRQLTSLWITPPIPG